MLSTEAVRNGFIAAIEAIRPTVFLTVAFNQPTSLLSAVRSVDALLRRIERTAHGKRWAAFPESARLKAYGFPEHPSTNLHFHIALSGSDRICTTALTDAPELWRKLVPTGHAHVESIKTKEAVARYITKWVSSDWSLEHYIAYGPGGK